MDVYEKFWAWFVKNASAISAAIASGRNKDIIQELNIAVDSIDPELAWEIGQGKDSDNLLLTISAEGDPELRAVVDSLFRHCPLIPGWQLSKYRQRKLPGKLQSLLQSQGRPIDLKTTKIALELSPSHERVNVSFRALDFERIRDDDKIASAFAVLDGLLGEELVETRAGRVAIQSQTDSEFMKLLDLPSFLAKLTGSSQT